MSNDLMQPLRAKSLDVVVRTPREWAERVSSAWNRSVAAIMDTSKEVFDAERALAGKPAELELFKKELAKRGISGATVSKLKRIAESKNFKSEHYECLPPSYNYLYDLAALDIRDYEKVYTKLSAGEDYANASLVLRKRKKKKGERLKVLFTVLGDPDKMSNADLAAMTTFIDAYARRSVISIHKTPLLNRLIAEEAE